LRQTKKIEGDRIVRLQLMSLLEFGDGLSVFTRKNASTPSVYSVLRGLRFVFTFCSVVCRGVSRGEDTRRVSLSGYSIGTEPYPEIWIVGSGRRGVGSEFTTSGEGSGTTTSTIVVDRLVDGVSETVCLVSGVSSLRMFTTTTVLLLSEVESDSVWDSVWNLFLVS